MQIGNRQRFTRSLCGTDCFERLVLTQWWVQSAAFWACIYPHCMCRQAAVDIDFTSHLANNPIVIYIMYNAK